MSEDASQMSSDKEDEGQVSGVPCMFCGLVENCEFKYGKFFQKSGLDLHYFCMLFSSALNQRGKSTREGILGFLVNDVKEEIGRGRKLRCCFCKQQGATIGCALKKCKRRFHFPCGLEHGSLYQYFGGYKSYCEEHRPRQKTPSSDRLSFHATLNGTCPICLCLLEARTSNETLRAPCCKNSWLHRSCLQQQALNAGYFFKCPLCNNKETFQLEMLEFGIYIPEQDASWELEDNAFHELLYRHNKCDLPDCRCPHGAEYNQNGSRWQLILCQLCGSQGCHIACGRLSFCKPRWECDICKPAFNTKKQKTVQKCASVNEVTFFPVRRLGRDINSPHYRREKCDCFVKQLELWRNDLLIQNEDDGLLAQTTLDVSSEHSSSEPDPTCPTMVRLDDEDEDVDIMTVADSEPSMVGSSKTSDVDVGSVASDACRALLISPESPEQSDQHLTRVFEYVLPNNLRAIVALCDSTEVIVGNEEPSSSTPAELAPICSLVCVHQQDSQAVYVVPEPQPCFGREEVDPSVCLSDQTTVAAPDSSVEIVYEETTPTAHLRSKKRKKHKHRHKHKRQKVNEDETSEADDKKKTKKKKKKSHRKKVSHTSEVEHKKKKRKKKKKKNKEKNKSKCNEKKGN